jgi:hypothetical protein
MIMLTFLLKDRYLKTELLDLLKTEKFDTQQIGFEVTSFNDDGLLKKLSMKY